jgi:hypothetical protein
MSNSTGWADLSETPFQCNSEKPLPRHWWRTRRCMHELPSHRAQRQLQRRVNYEQTHLNCVAASDISLLIDPYAQLGQVATNGICNM